MNGRVSNLQSEKGFGFIKADNSSDEYFFHQSSLRDVHFHDLKIGTIVTFEPTETQKGLRAENVELGGF